MTHRFRCSNIEIEHIKEVDNVKRPVRHAGRWVDGGVKDKGLLVPEDDVDDIGDDRDDDAFVCNDEESLVHVGSE